MRNSRPFTWRVHNTNDYRSFAIKYLRNTITLMARIPTLNGPTTPSILGGAARRFRLHVITATRNCGRSEWAISFGARMRHADSSATHIGASRLRWNEEAGSRAVGKECFVQAWLMFLNDVPILMSNAHVFGNSSRNTPNLDWLLLTKRPQNIERLVPVAQRLAKKRLVGHERRKPNLS